MYYAGQLGLQMIKPAFQCLDRHGLNKEMLSAPERTPWSRTLFGSKLKLSCVINSLATDCHLHATNLLLTSSFLYSLNQIQFTEQKKSQPELKNRKSLLPNDI